MAMMSQSIPAEIAKEIRVPNEDIFGLKRPESGVEYEVTLVADTLGNGHGPRVWRVQEFGNMTLMSGGLRELPGSVIKAKITWQEITTEININGDGSAITRWIPTSIKIDGIQC